jgi:RNA polymerase sigma factor (sigma-70 family)
MPDENELYQAWIDAPPEEKEKVALKLVPLLQRHARAVIWMILTEPRHEEVEDLAQEIVAAALRLGRFKRESRFSTWVQAIANRKCWQELRSRKRRGAVIDEFAEIEGEDGEVHIEDHAALAPFARINVKLSLEQLAEGLSAEETELHGLVLEGLDQNAIADRLGISPAAAETRRRRLRDKLREIVGLA